MCYHARFLQLPVRGGVQVLGEFYNISYQVDLIQFLQEEHQGSKGFGMVGYLV